MNYRMEYKKLYKGEELTGFEVVPSELTPKMWRVKYPDGTLSKDHYNLTWAKEHCYAEARLNLEGVQIEQRSSPMRYFKNWLLPYLKYLSSPVGFLQSTPKQVQKHEEQIQIRS